jgi:hypothetical protein
VTANLAGLLVRVKVERLPVVGDLQGAIAALDRTEQRVVDTLLALGLPFC